MKALAVLGLMLLTSLVTWMSANQWDGEGPIKRCGPGTAYTCGPCPVDTGFAQFSRCSR